MSGSITPKMRSGGNGTAQTNNPGTTYVALTAQRCAQVTLVNNTGTTIGFRQDNASAEVPVFDQTYYPIYGLEDASQISIRRVDASNTQVTLAYRWEG